MDLSTSRYIPSYFSIVSPNTGIIHEGCSRKKISHSFVEKRTPHINAFLYSLYDLGFPFVRNHFIASFLAVRNLNRIYILGILRMVPTLIAPRYKECLGVASDSIKYDLTCLKVLEHARVSGEQKVGC